ncbi:MAG: cell division protein FtsL [Burkholderiales bacterium]|nr:cell division protein FtsL [Burkholderiales bacterium]
MIRINVVLAALVWISAFALVTSQYRVRQLTIEINRARDQAYQLDTDRTRATLVQSRLSTPSIVERTARDRLGMDLPEGARTFMVELPASAAVQSLTTPTAGSSAVSAAR